MGRMDGWTDELSIEEEKKQQEEKLSLKMCLDDHHHHHQVFVCPEIDMVYCLCEPNELLQLHEACISRLDRL